MKSKFATATIISLLLIALALNVLIFMLAPDGVLELGSFWVVWTFTFPINFLMAMFAVWFATKKSTEAIVRIPTIMYVTYVFAAIYFAVGTKLMIVHWDSVKIPLAIEIVITIAYIIAFTFMALSVGYMEATQGRMKKKLMYIGLLETDVKSTLAFVSDADTKARLQKLAEKIRFSDPMSHDSLASCEQEIETLVRYVVATLRADGTADVSKKITEIEALIDYRNERCKILK